MPSAPILPARLRRGAASLVLGVGLGLTGCAGMNTLTSEVNTYGSWPPERAAGTYVFERLPSQQARPDQQQRLEAAARPALAAAGFKPADDAQTAEFVVQLSMHSAPNERMRIDPYLAWQSVPSPLHGAPLRPSPYVRSPWIFPVDPPSYEREVVVLIRDPKRGQTLYESHAVSDGTSPYFNGLLGAMMAAALKDFPKTDMGPRRVSTPLTKE